VNNELQNMEQSTVAPLTTAALAAAGETTPLKDDLDLRFRELELQRHEPGTGGPSAAGGDGVARTAAAPALAHEEQAAPLFSPEEAKELRARWDAVQGAFVDEPRQAVEQADRLVAGAMTRLAEMFADERAKLEGQWDRGDDVSTEGLRLALRRYRSFFGRLLSV
jgi:hypothetical protein